MRTPDRGQALVEVTLGLLVLIPIILGGIFFAEAATFRLKATEAATEPLWDATAYQQQSYTGNFNRTPSAVSAAEAGALTRGKAEAMVFTSATKPKLRCKAGNGLGLSIGPTAGVYTDNGGMSCQSELTVDPKGMTRFFAEGGRGFFEEPLRNMEKQFKFCATEKCKPFVMAVGDWGLTDLNGEAEECHLTMSGCANSGYFAKADAVFQSNRTGGGTESQAFVQLVNGVLRSPVAGLPSAVDFQMSFRGSESGFFEQVPVDEGEGAWRTTPSLGAWGASYGARSESFLGR